MTAKPISNASRWPAAYGPMGVPRQKDIDQAIDMFTRIAADGDTPENSRKAKDKINNLENSIARILNAAAAIPKDRLAVARGAPDPTLYCHIQFESKLPTGKPGDTFIAFAEHANTIVPKHDYPTYGPLNVTPETLMQNIAACVADYRRHVARVELELRFAHGDEKTNHAIEIAHYEGGLGDPQPRQLEPCHPANILEEISVVGHEFVGQHEPYFIEGSPQVSWANSYASEIELTLAIPLSLIPELDGRPLHKVIEIPDDLLGKIPPHARQAWFEVVIARGSRYKHDYSTGPGLVRVVLPLEPIRQTLWLNGSLPYDHIATTALEQAIVNLAMTGEII